MASLRQVTQFLDKELDIHSIEDTSINGLQVGDLDSKKPIKKVGFAVDCCMETFKKAKDAGCDVVVVHHGLLWQNDIKETAITRYNYQRVKFLIENNIALYGCHLPLDKHRKYGNNALLFKMLGASPSEEFGGVGYSGSFKNPKSLKSIIKTLNTKLGAKCEIMKYGKDQIKTIAICSGGAQFDAFHAIRKDIDLYISGEIGHTILHPVKEAKLNVVGAGHYATEIIGVKALMPLLAKKFKVKTVFLDTPTGL